MSKGMGPHTGTTLRTTNIRMAATAAAWTMSLVCMIIGTVHDETLWRAWGIWLALVACCFTGWGTFDYVARKQRLRLEDLARIMAAEASDYYRTDPTLTRIH